jgi:two-component system sensor histidine kinase QseC
MYSVRRRLLLVLAAGFALLVAATGIHLAGLLGERVTEEFDAALLARHQALVSLTETEQGRIELDYSPGVMPEFEREENPDYFQFWLDDGRVLLRSTHLKGDLARSESVPTAAVVRDTTLPDGRPGRLVELRFLPKAPDEEDEEEEGPAPTATERHAVVLVVARGRERLDELLARMRLAIFGSGGVTILLAVLFVWRALAAGFRPLDRITAQVRELDADRLGSRIALPATPRELAPIVDQLNALLERLAASFARERRFAGNVAHELRTPIAELRSLADVASKWPEDPASTERFFGDVREIAERMEGVVANLLLLARCQAGVEKVDRTPTNLRQAVAVSWERVRRTTRATEADLDLDLADDLVVETDAGKLDIILANVLNNAVGYARPGGRVRCVGARNGTAFRLEISNPAEPLSEIELPRLAEPFWRKDEARSSSDHAGLGLSVVAALAELLELEVGFDQRADGVFRVLLSGALSSP